jgi:hypothetical protein
MRLFFSGPADQPHAANTYTVFPDIDVIDQSVKLSRYMRRLSARRVI